ncbi:MAG: hypothetical protein RI885_2147 [Actinomycetota bacterium]
MQLEGLGSSVVIALAAVLWLVYLIPTWFRRREYLSTERNAVRLQQTLRIMAETAEVPEQVHLESSARAVAVQQRMLHQAEQRQRAIHRAREAMMRRDAARTLATLRPSVASEVLRTSVAARRLRRSRAATSGVLLVSMLVVASGLLVPNAVLPVSVLPVAVAPMVVGGGVAAGVASVLLLTVLAAAGRRRTALMRELRSRPAAPRRVVTETPAVADAPAARSSWTPVPIPKPLYLSRPPVQPIVSEAAAQQERDRLLAEAERAERMLRERERAEKVTPIRPATPALAPAAAAPAAAAPAAPSRFATMGFVDAADSTVTDLDAVLRRRRAV